MIAPNPTRMMRDVAIRSHVKEQDASFLRRCGKEDAITALWKSRK
jgi:hypothetical protein